MTSERKGKDIFRLHHEAAPPIKSRRPRITQIPLASRMWHSSTSAASAALEGSHLGGFSEGQQCYKLGTWGILETQPMFRHRLSDLILPMEFFPGASLPALLI